MTDVLLPNAAAGRRTNVRWAVLAVVALTYMLGAADRANLAVALPYIKRDFHLDNAQAGATASVFFLGVTLIQVPGSLLIQRVRVRAVMIGAILLTSLATLLTGLAGGATQLLGARTILGVAEGPLPIGGLSTINRWFPTRERATAVGIFVAAFKLSPAIVPPIAAAIIYAYGWRDVFAFFAAPGLLLAIAWYFTSDDPRRSAKANALEIAHIQDDVSAGSTAAAARHDSPVLDRIVRARHHRPLDSNAAILRCPSLWGCSVAYALMSGLSYAILTWVPTYLVEVKHFRLMQVGIVAAAPWVGAVLGSVGGGILSDKVFGQRRKPVMMITAGSCAVTMYGLVHAPNDPLALGGLLFCTGLLLSVGYSTFVVYPMGMAVKARVPLAVAIVSTLGAIGAGVAPVVMGVILDRAGWDAAFAFLSIISIVALALVAIIIEPRPMREGVEPGTPALER